MEQGTAVMASARLFIAFALPPHIHAVLHDTLRHYTASLERIVPPERWHITLLFLGEVSDSRKVVTTLAEPLDPTFLPTISLTHVGAGRAPGHLWAYVNPTSLLHGIRDAFVSRLNSVSVSLPPHILKRPFVPHLHLGYLNHDTSPLGIPDYPLAKTFVPAAVHIYRSDHSPDGPTYTIEQSIPLDSAAS